jgi:hypothetical protein
MSYIRRLHVWLSYRRPLVGFLTLAVGVIAAAVALSEQNYRSCREVERLKAALRQDAEEDYAIRRQTYAAFRVRPTPELDALALAARDQALRLFAADECARLLR